MGEGQEMASLTWNDLRPEGLGAVPLGKEFKALETIESETTGGEVGDGEGNNGEGLENV